MTSEIRTNSLTSRAGLSTVTLTDSGPMFSGITTFVDNSTFSVGTGGTIHAPATNVMALGTNSIDAIKIDSSGNVNITGILTASSFSGGVSLANGADNRVVTATGANAIQGEAGLTYDGNDLTITGAIPSLKFTESDGNPDYQLLSNNGIFKIHDVTNSADRFAVNTNGTGYFLSNFQIGSTTTSPGATLHIKANYPSLKVDSGGHASDAYVRIISGNAQNSRVDFGDSDDDNIGIIDYDHANNSMSFTTNTTERLRITSDGKIGINDSTPSVTLETVGHNQVTFGSMPETIITYGTTSAYNSGSAGSGIQFGGYYNSTPEYTIFAGVHGVKENTSDGYYNGALVFSTRAQGGGSAERLRITSSGNLGIGNNRAAYPIDMQSTSSALTLNLKLNKNSTTNDYAEIAFQLWSGADTGDNTFGGSGQSRPSVVLRGVNEQGSSASGAFVIGTFTGGSNNNTLQERVRVNSLGDLLLNQVTNDTRLGIKQRSSAVDFITCRNTASTLKMYVHSSGNLYNTNGNYSQISDQSLKENIVDAKSQWNDIKNIKIRNFNFTEASGLDTHTQIGCVAQEVETVSPKLVSAPKDGVKTVATSVLYMKAVKALQEAMTRIETLEQDNIALRVRVTNLEGN